MSGILWNKVGKWSLFGLAATALLKSKTLAENGPWKAIRISCDRLARPTSPRSPIFLQPCAGASTKKHPKRMVPVFETRWCWFHQHQPTSTNINQHQLTSTNINQHQPSTNIVIRGPTSTSTNQWQGPYPRWSAPISRCPVGTRHARCRRLRPRWRSRWGFCSGRHRPGRSPATEPAAQRNIRW